ncbi:gliding motility-associated C-terminal domain-containing protein [Myroides odoratus]|uniref:gliding motility-associated C-terminal domain-containing protein n=1 Tax=Myroides odoratus TaxID=256 RepID=UPI0009EA7622|nr:gliding motility-associated C-terminal domain-containing protein [Myroides odoratus]
MKKNIALLSGIMLASFASVAQEVHQITNIGTMSIQPQTKVSTYFNFVNTASGNVFNDGEFYFHDDYENDGLFAFSSTQRTGKVVFEGDNKSIQNISGDSPSIFYNVIFNKSGDDYSFNLSNDISSEGSVDFMDGIVWVNKQEGGAFLFLKGATHVNASDKSYVEGEVNKKGNEIFKYPIGNKKKYRYAKISASKNSKDVFVGKYVFEDEDFFNKHVTKSGLIQELNNKEYWIIDRADNTAGDILLTLSWDERTTPATLLNDVENNMHIVRWDSDQELWVDEGGVVDMSSKEITTISTVKGYGVFTLATVKKGWNLEGDVVIYNLVTPDNDGKNDYFIIENINKYPNNRVEIYNRWGVKVYETTNYDSNGDGSTNVFTGYSGGKVTVDKNKKLPSGTYYYVINYEYKDDNGSRMIRKAANLHLESN